MLYINHSEIKDTQIIVLEVQGQLNSITSNDFEDHINQLLERRHNAILFDAAGLEFISSEGIGAILYLDKTLRTHGGGFVICNLPNEIDNILKLLGLHTSLSIAVNRDEAVALLTDMVRKDQPTIPEPEHFEQKIDGIESSTGSEAITIEAPADESQIEQHEEFQSPLIVECSECGGLIRVKRDGTYQCPYCQTQFTAEKDHTIIF